MLVTCPYVDDHWEIKFERITFELSGEQEKDTRAITQKITFALENIIRQYPEQYFWMHRRWRARPNADPEPIY